VHAADCRLDLRVIDGLPAIAEQPPHQVVLGQTPCCAQVIPESQPSRHWHLRACLQHRLDDGQRAQEARLAQRIGPQWDQVACLEKRVNPPGRVVGALWIQMCTVRQHHGDQPVEHRLRVERDRLRQRQPRQPVGDGAAHHLGDGRGVVQMHEAVVLDSEVWQGVGAGEPLPERLAVNDALALHIGGCRVGADHVLIGLLLPEIAPRMPSENACRDGDAATGPGVALSLRIIIQLRRRRLSKEAVRLVLNDPGDQHLHLALELLPPEPCRHAEQVELPA